MSTSILVTGGTGTLGSHVVPRLRATGNDLRILSREHHERELGSTFMRGDLAAGDGLDAAVDGAETIVHLAGTAKGDDAKARNLVDAAKRAGVRHLVFISVVGADRVPIKSAMDRAMFGYFGAKRGAEEVITKSGIPWTILRATQFHDLTFTTVEGMGKMPIVPVPRGWLVQPIDSEEIAERLVELVPGDASGLVSELGGSHVYEMSDLVRSYMRGVGKWRPILPMPMGGSAFRAVRDGATIIPDRAVGQRTWESFLTDRLGMEGVLATE